MRTDTIAGWEVTAVDGSGVERALRFDGQSWLHVAEGMAGLPEKRRMDVCQAWATPGAVGPVVGSVVEVRVYRTWTPIERDQPPRRELRVSCRL